MLSYIAWWSGGVKKNDCWWSHAPRLSWSLGRPFPTQRLDMRGQSAPCNDFGISSTGQERKLKSNSAAQWVKTLHLHQAPVPLIIEVPFKCIGMNHVRLFQRLPRDMNKSMCYQAYKGMDWQPLEMPPRTECGTYLGAIQQNTGVFMRLAGYSQCFIATF